jgi:hypothetical protein
VTALCGLAATLAWLTLGGGVVGNIHFIALATLFTAVRHTQARCVRRRGECHGERGRRSVDEMVDSVQSDESGNDKVDGNDVIQQARQNQDQDACDKRNDRRKMFGSEDHDDLLGG